MNRDLDTLLKVSKEDIAGMSDYEILVVFLSYITKNTAMCEVSEKILANFSSLQELLMSSESRLTALGIKASLTPTLFEYRAIIREFAIRTVRLPPKTIFSKETHIDFARMIRAYIGYFEKETIIAILFTEKQQFLTMETVALGSDNIAIFDSKTIIDTMQRHSASMCILAHNHPSGVGYASKEDNIATEEIERELLASELVLLDHFIVTSKTVFSIKNACYIIK